MRRLLVNPHRKDSEIKKFSQTIDSEIPYKVDFSLSATDRGTSVSSITWSSEGSRSVTISNKALASSVASADVSASYSGEALIKCVANYADSNTETQYIKIMIHDPEWRNYS